MSALTRFPPLAINLPCAFYPAALDDENRLELVKLLPEYFNNHVLRAIEKLQHTDAASRFEGMKILEFVAQLYAVLPTPGQRYAAAVNLKFQIEQLRGMSTTRGGLDRMGSFNGPFTEFSELLRKHGALDALIKLLHINSVGIDTSSGYAVEMHIAACKLLAYVSILCLYRRNRMKWEDD